MKISTNPLTTYRVNINSDSFETSAKSQQAAISKCAYRYAVKTGESVELVQWKIKNRELNVEVKDIK